MKKSQPSHPKSESLDTYKDNHLPIAISSNTLLLFINNYYRLYLIIFFLSLADNPEKVNKNTETSMVLSSLSTQNIAAANRLINHIMPKPKWHPPWKSYRVISGHLGWVRCVTVEPGNEWFATGAADRVIKVILQKIP